MDVEDERVVRLPRPAQPEAGQEDEEDKQGGGDNFQKGWIHLSSLIAYPKIM